MTDFKNISAGEPLFKMAHGLAWAIISLHELTFYVLNFQREHKHVIKSPGILGVTLCFCTGSYTAAAAAGRSFLSTR